MKNETKLQTIVHLAKSAGFDVRTYSPGDGVTRYRFGHGEDYFSMSSTYTALGTKEALAYASGLADGKAWRN
jgi:hypothetical protein